MELGEYIGVKNLFSPCLLRLAHSGEFLERRHSRLWILRIDQINMESQNELADVFDWLEYTVFGATLMLSVAIGIYHGFIKTKGQDSVEGYILGSKQISIVPMATSLIASFISGIALLGLASDTYVYGTQIIMANAGLFIVCLINARFFMPVFYKLQVVSIYEYLEGRFDQHVRKAASVIFAFYLLTYIPIVIYTPAIALNQVGKINIHLITPIVCAVCIFYTSVGGLKAVVWTDVFQTTIMVGSTLWVIWIGVQEGGGFEAVASKVVAGERWEWFNMDIDPTTRITFWTTTVGMIPHWLGETAINPSFVQRLVALKTESTAKMGVFILFIGVAFFRTVAGSIGLLAYARYSKCDPLSTKTVIKPDQISPHFVLDVAGHLKGIPGVYMSGIFSAALSTMSTGLNTIAATVFKDLMLPFYKNPPSDKRTSQIMKRLSLFFGIICVLLIFLVEKLGGVIEMSSSLGGSSCGLLLGVFVLGMFVPFGNSKGAYCALLSGSMMMIWIITGNRWARAQGLLKDPIKPFSVEECAQNVTSTYGSTARSELVEVFYLYNVTVFYHSTIVFFTTFIVGLCASWCTGGNRGKTLNPDYFSPIVHKFLKDTIKPTKEHPEQNDGNGYHDVPMEEMN